MGFENFIRESNLIPIILYLCTKKNKDGKNVIEYHCEKNNVELTETLLSKWESDIHYNGYSTVFHILYPIIYNIFSARTIHDVSYYTKMYVRNKILEAMNISSTWSSNTELIEKEFNTGFLNLELNSFHEINRVVSSLKK